MAREVMFSVDDVSDIVERMDGLRDGSGWMVLDAAVAEEDLPPPAAFSGLFSGKGPDVPELSWVWSPAISVGGALGSMPMFGGTRISRPSTKSSSRG